MFLFNFAVKLKKKIVLPHTQPNHHPHRHILLAERLVEILAFPVNRLVNRVFDIVLDLQ